MAILNKTTFVKGGVSIIVILAFLTVFIGGNDGEEAAYTDYRLENLASLDNPADTAVRLSKGYLKAQPVKIDLSAHGATLFANCLQDYVQNRWDKSDSKATGREALNACKKAYQDDPLGFVATYAKAP